MTLRNGISISQVSAVLAAILFAKSVSAPITKPTRGPTKSGTLAPCASVGVKGDAVLTDGRLVGRRVLNLRANHAFILTIGTQHRSLPFIPGEALTNRVVDIFRTTLASS